MGVLQCFTTFFHDYLPCNPCCAPLSYLNSIGVASCLSCSLGCWVSGSRWLCPQECASLRCMIVMHADCKEPAHLVNVISACRSERISTRCSIKVGSNYKASENRMVTAEAGALSRSSSFSFLCIIVSQYSSFGSLKLLPACLLKHLPSHPANSWW